jgi:hypothetical protein
MPTKPLELPPKVARHGWGPLIDLLRRLWMQCFLLGFQFAMSCSRPSRVNLSVTRERSS